MQEIASSSWIIFFKERNYYTINHYGPLAYAKAVLYVKLILFFFFFLS